MKLSNYFFYTLREDVKDEDSISSNLLVRSGMITKIGSGIYSYLPLGFKVDKKIENVIREEMDKSGANELVMPSLIPEDYYVASGRRDNFGDSMFTLKDRADRNYCLGPTHEELFVTVAKNKVHSYKDLPFNIYQMATKYRDERRPRYGLIRVREFTMKDAYSFDASIEGLDKSYEIMRNAYNNIFDKLGINYKIVKADTGSMGGSLSEEYQAITDIGEDTVVLCSSCDYASNEEVCEIKTNIVCEYEEKERELINTPNTHTVEEVANYLNVDIARIVKTLIYKVNDKLVACLIQGDREINETKLTKIFNVLEVELATDEEIKKETGTVKGFIGPIDLNLEVLIDEDVLKMKNFIVGANKDDYHYINVNIKDFKYNLVDNIKTVREGDICPKCGNKLVFKKGIEIGNIFKLGTKYSDALNLQYLDESNKLQPVVMGCYGIGVGRVMAAIAEQNASEKGISWPSIIAPFDVVIVPVSMKDETQVKLANNIYDELKNKGVDVLFDDRDERLGVKLNDMELIGIPKTIVVGRKAEENMVELNKVEIEVSKILEQFNN